MSDTNSSDRDLDSEDSDDEQGQDDDSGSESDAEGATESGQAQRNPDDEGDSGPSRSKDKENSKGHPSTPLSQQGLYHYDQGIINRQRQEQDERNFARLDQKRTKHLLEFNKKDKASKTHFQTVFQECLNDYCINSDHILDDSCYSAEKEDPLR